MLSALAELIEKDQRFSLVSTVSSTDACLQATLSVPSLVLVVDWSLPTVGAEKLMQTLRDNASEAKVVVCSHVSSKEIPKRAMAVGGAGYFCHSDPSSELLEVIESVAKGRMVFPYLDVRELNDPLQSLTRTERLLLHSLSTGRTNKELAAEHSITVNTVKFHLRNLYDKLGVSNRTQAIALFYSLKIDDAAIPSSISDAYP